MTFDRWQCGWPRTGPYVLFQGHHTELNNLYWSNAAAAAHAVAAANAAKGSDAVGKVLRISPLNARRVSGSIADWRFRFKESENWVRLNALMGLTGYLETYLHSIVSLALTSDPGVLVSSPRAVDGLRLIKEGNLPDMAPHILRITSGAWPDRVRNYGSLFRTVPMVLSASVKELETMRKLRNGVGHAFGRAIEEYRDPLLLRPVPVQRLAEDRLQRWLGIVEACVAAIEDHLRPTHVGAVEALLRYHRWDRKYEAGHVSEARAFRSLFQERHGTLPKVGYFRDLIAYYQAA